MPNATGTHAAATMSAPSGIGHVTIVGHRDELGVGTGEHRRDDALADVTIRHVGADLADGARALVADDVRRHRQHAARAVQRVAAFDADRLDFDQHATGRADRIGNVLVAEDVRRAGLVVDGSLHGRILSAMPACARVATHARPSSVLALPGLTG